MKSIKYIFSIVLIWGIAVHGSLRVQAQTLPETTKDIPVIRTSLYRAYTPRECELLERIARAEAGNQGVIGMALVIKVVDNRVQKTGKSVEEIIFSPRQFYVKGMPRSGNAESLEALLLVMNGWDESEGALYFCATGWSSCGKEHLFKYGDHYFSK